MMRANLSFTRWRKWPTAAVRCARLAFYLAAIHGSAQDCSIAITEQPNSLTLSLCSTASFSVTASTSAEYPLSYQWFRNGAAVVGATNSFYTTPVLRAADDQSRFYVVLSNACEVVRSTEAVVTVALAGAKPTLLGATGGPTLETVTVHFFAGGGCCGEPLIGLDPVSATNICNYTLSGGLVVSNAMLDECKQDVILTTSPQTEGILYSVTVSNVLDVRQNIILSGPVSLTPCNGFAISRQPKSYTVLENCQATFSVIIEGSMGFPPTGPSYQWFKDGVAIPDTTNSFYTTPPATHLDDQSRFYVVVSNACARVTSQEGVLVFSWDVVRPWLVSASGGPSLNTVTLKFYTGSCGGSRSLHPPSANDPYNYTLSGGLEVLSAILQPDGGTVILTTSPQNDGGTYLVTVINVADLAGNLVVPRSLSFTACSAVTIGRQPSPLATIENCHASFSVLALGTPPFFFQWFQEGVAIPDATNSSYTTPRVTVLGDQTHFSAVVRNACGVVRSTEAALTVFQGIGPPWLAGATGGPTLDTITARFGGWSCLGPVGFLDPMSAMDIFNYMLTGGLVVSNAVLAPDGASVVLTTSPQVPGAEYTLYVEGVMDRAGNRVSLGSHATFHAWMLIRVSIERSGTNCVISWEPATGTLEAAEYLGGTWTPIPSATSPHSIPIENGRRFYRVAAP